MMESSLPQSYVRNLDRLTPSPAGHGRRPALLRAGLETTLYGTRCVLAQLDAVHFSNELLIKSIKVSSEDTVNPFGRLPPPSAVSSAASICATVEPSRLVPVP